MTVDNFVSSSRRSLSQDIQKLKQVWLELDSNSCPNYYNFHMHTIFSDGRLEPLQLIKQALDIGLKGFAITDHHNIDAYNIVQNWLEEDGSSCIRGNIFFARDCGNEETGHCSKYP